MEGETGNPLPFLKQEPSDVPMHFLYPGARDPRNFNQVIRPSGSHDFDAPSAIIPSVPDNPSNIHFRAVGEMRTDAIAMQTPKDRDHSHVIDLSGHSVPLDSGAGEGGMAPNNESNESTEFNVGEVDTNKQASSSLNQYESANSADHTHKSVVQETTTSSNDRGSCPTETVVAIPVEELPPFEQLNLKTDVFMNGGDVEDVQFLGSSEANNSQKNTSRESRENGSKLGSSESVRKLEDISQQIPTKDLDSFETSGEKMERKIADRSRTMQTRSLSGSLPKVCRVKGTVDNSVLKGLGKRQFNCTICNERFSQKILLKKHVKEVHEGQPSGEINSDKLFESVTFSCPLCDSRFSRKYGLKRHFASRHEDVDNIPCPECKYKAKKLTDYLKHVDKHKPFQTGPASTPFEINQSKNFQLKCRECRQIFQSDEALRLHILIHKINLSLSSSESFELSEGLPKCTCAPGKPGVRNGKADCLLHSSSNSAPTTDTSSHLDSFKGLSEELRSVAEDSVGTMSQLTSKLDSLARSITCGGSAAFPEDPLSAINSISSLSIELTNLATTLSHILFRDSVMKKEAVAEDVETVDDDVEPDFCEEDEPSQDTAGGIEPDTFNNNTSLDDTTDKTSSENSIVKKAEDIPMVKVEVLAQAEDVDKPMEPPPKTKGKRGRKKGTVVKMTRKKKMAKGPANPSESICVECGKDFKDCANLKRHLLTHLDIRPYKCSKCKMSFRRKEHLSRHSVKHTDARPFKCEVCEYAAKTRKTLRTHMLVHGERRCFPCRHCTYKGRTRTELLKHERKHNPCPLCGYMASDNADYTMHKRSHLSFTCTECDYSCYTSWQLRRHLKTHNPTVDESAEKFCCELCGYSCTDKRRFAYHMTRHENKTPYACPDCDYKCSSRSSFDAHKLMHAGLRPFLCSICGASFRRTSHLNNHMLIHKEEKKHVCKTCGRPFRARHNLKQHEMIHTGEKQHKCHLCSFACRRNKELRIHLAKHSVSDMKFSRPYNPPYPESTFQM